VLLVHGKGSLEAAALLQKVGGMPGLSYAITLDVAAWVLTRYQTPAAAWAYVRPMDEWVSALRRRGVHRARPRERADLILLRGPEGVLRGAHVVEGLVLVDSRRLLEDCARLGGRRGLDAARLFVAFPEARAPGLRLDPDALLKVFGEVIAST